MAMSARPLSSPSLGLEGVPSNRDRPHSTREERGTLSQQHREVQSDGVEVQSGCTREQIGGIP